MKTGFFFDDFKKLTDSCISFYEENKSKMNLERVRKRRAELSHFVRLFHRDCETFTPSVQKRIEDLADGFGLVLMTAHQPNFFAYSGVFRKATLNFVLAKKLEEMLGVPVVNFFGIADQDFTDDRWVRSCQLPAVQRSDGILTIDAKLPEKMMLNKVAKPSAHALNKWRAEVEKWLNEAVRSVGKLCRTMDVAEMCSAASTSTLRENLKSFWSVVEDVYAVSENYSDFNAFLMSKIVNDVWGYDTVFARFSECQQTFVEEFNFLLSRFGEYSRLLTEAKQKLCDDAYGDGVSNHEPFLTPFWYHCSCGSKVKLFLIEKEGLLFGAGNCLSCGRFYELEFGPEDKPDISDFASKVSARALPMPLVFFKGLMPSCYIGGVGGVKYLKEAEYVAERLRIDFPPIAVWRPPDKYMGIGQMEALLELKRICRELGTQNVSDAKNLLNSRASEIRSRLEQFEMLKAEIAEKLKVNPKDEKLKAKIKKVSMSQSEFIKSSNLSVIIRELKILENVSTVLNLIPSILDYAVNVGLKETSKQWIRHLYENGSLFSDVHVESVLNHFADIDSPFWKTVPSLHGEPA